MRVLKKFFQLWIFFLKILKWNFADFPKYFTFFWKIPQFSRIFLNFLEFSLISFNFLEHSKALTQFSFNNERFHRPHTHVSTCCPRYRTFLHHFRSCYQKKCWSNQTKNDIWCFEFRVLLKQWDQLTLWWASCVVIKCSRTLQGFRFQGIQWARGNFWDFGREGKCYGNGSELGGILNDNYF